jgi:predicted nucleic-acid-binding Zn-ribbon protein
MEDKIKIKCPHCGCEYLPAEIYYPDSFLGKPTDIIRNKNGKIDFYSGSSCDLSEEFTCLNCGTTFSIQGNIVFTVKELGNNDEEMSEDYTVKLPPSPKQ